MASSSCHALQINMKFYRYELSLIILIKIITFVFDKYLIIYVFIS